MIPVSMKFFGLTFKVGEEGQRLSINNCLMSQRKEEGTDEVNTWVWRKSEFRIRHGCILDRAEDGN